MRCRTGRGLRLRLVRSVAFGSACCVGLTLLHAKSASAPNELSAKTWGHQSWSTENGLPQNSVHQILQTKDGYLWIATEGGLSRFDGLTFKTFTQESDQAFTSDDICCLAQDSRGSLWVGTADGLLQYSGGEFRRFSVRDGLPSSAIEAVAVASDGGLLVLTGDGVARWDGKTFVSLPSSGATRPSAVGSAGGEILLANSSGVRAFRNGDVLPGSSYPNSPSGRVEGIGGVPGGGFWVRTRSSIAAVQGDHQRTWTAGAELPGSRVESFLADSQGNFWAGTNKGLVSIGPSGMVPEVQREIGTSAVLSIFQDREDNLWVGTETAGLHVLRPQKFRTLPELGDHAITAGTEAVGGAVWVGTNGDGIDRWQSGVVEHFSTRNGLASDVVLTVAADRKGGVWIGTADGLNHVQNSKVETFTSADGLPDDFVRSLLVDDDDSLWIGTRRGLAHWQVGHFKVWTRAEGLQSDLVGALLKVSDGDVWIGTLDGLSRLHDGVIKTYTTKDGLSGNVITSLLHDASGALWIGTKGNGLTRWANNRFTPLQGPDLPGVVNALLVDARGYLWISSTHGITRVLIEDLNACGASPECILRVNTFGYSDGMPTDEASGIGHPSAWMTSDGMLWFGTRKGVAIVDPNRLSETLPAPPTVIERFIVDGSDLNPSVEGQEIPPGRSRFDFEYAGLSFAETAKVRYRYMLEGFDKNWTLAGSRRIASYTNLPPGHYRFRVQTADDNGVWSETGASLSFHIQPPFYRRVWFYALVLAAIAAIIALLYRLRVRRLRSQFDAVLSERTRIAREIHDTLAQGFVGVSVQLEVTSQLLAQSQVAAAHQQLDQTRALVRQGLADARRSIWELRATTAQDALPVQLTRQVEQAAQGHFTSSVEIGGTYRVLSSELEREVLRIAQEGLTNIVRHADASHVSVSLRYHSSLVVLSIADDGRGFNSSDDSLLHGGHFGLQGMRERAAQIGARLQIESFPGKGTTLILEVPVTTERHEK
jgi:signal transduction histidine kinase/ligand-binding sensor domain-containing protein